MAAQTSASAKNGAGGEYRGLDLGTSRIVLAKMNGEKPKFEAQLNAFLGINYSRMTETMLEREGILHRRLQDQILPFGNRVDEFANMFGGDTRRPMRNGLLNPDEPEGLEVLEGIVEQLCGKAGKARKVCFSVPGAPPGRESDLIFHEKAIATFLQELGYETKSINEGLAVVYSLLSDTHFTGIGISFGGGMCNACVAYLGLPALTLCTTRAGDYIDRSAASVTGETPITVRMYKETGFSLEGEPATHLDEALSVYYDDVIQGVAEALERELGSCKTLPRFKEPIPLVCSGGTSRVKGFLHRFKRSVDKLDLPVKISQVWQAKDVLNSTATGTLMAAMTDM